jgi:DNA repair protein RecN (Recombination protein N)
VVSKLASSEGTLSQIDPVVGDKRVSEIARMLGGEVISETTLAHAREMLEQVILGKEGLSSEERKSARSSKKTQGIKS